MMEYGTVSETQTKEKDDTGSILSMLFRGRCRTHGIGGKWPSCSVSCNHIKRIPGQTP